MLDATAKLEAEFVLLLQKLRSSDRLESSNNSNVLDGKPVQNHNNISNHASSLAAAPDTKSNRKSLWAGSNKSSITLTPPTTAAGISDDGSFYRYDDPQHISLPPPLNPAQTQNILLQLLKVIQSKTQSQEIETTDGWQAQVCFLLCCCRRCRYSSFMKSAGLPIGKQKTVPCATLE